MRYLVVSDIHANLEALEAVLADAPPHDATICLGDIVGYGPNPNDCIERIRELPGLLSLVGNHDLAAIGVLDLAMFNDVAARAAAWTATQLTPGARAYLERIPPAAPSGRFQLAHASPRDPIWEYMESAEQGPPNFALFQQRVCFVGHTHVPRVFEEPSRVYVPRPGATLAVFAGPRRIVNPGSVGQPRDRDSRAAYALFDDETGVFAWRRVPYDVAATQAGILASGLPAALADRLSFGI